MYEILFEMNLKCGDIVYNYSGIKETILRITENSKGYLVKNNLYEGTRIIHRLSIFIDLKYAFLKSYLDIGRYERK